MRKITKSQFHEYKLHRAEGISKKEAASFAQVSFRTAGRFDRVATFEGYQRLARHEAISQREHFHRSAIEDLKRMNQPKSVTHKTSYKVVVSTNNLAKAIRSQTGWIVFIITLLMLVIILA